MLRLKKRSQFQKVYKKGAFSKSPDMSLGILLNGLQENRVGVTFNTKNIPSSVSRNRCKRLAMESYRLTEDYIRRGYDIVFAFRRDASSLKLSKVMDEALSLYKRSGILK